LGAHSTLIEAISCQPAYKLCTWEFQFYFKRLTWLLLFLLNWLTFVRNIASWGQICYQMAQIRQMTSEHATELNGLFLNMKDCLLKMAILTRTQQSLFMTLFSLTPQCSVKLMKYSYPKLMLYLGHFRCKMAFFTRERQKVNVLPHLCSIKILWKNE